MIIELARNLCFSSKRVKWVYKDDVLYDSQLIISQFRFLDSTNSTHEFVSNPKKFIFKTFGTGVPLSIRFVDVNKMYIFIILYLQ